MKRRKFIGITGGAMASVGLSAISSAQAHNNMANTNRKILVFGGGYNPPFLRYFASLTGKTTPRLCFLPTASADSAANIVNWYQTCADLNVKPFAQRMFINSYEQKQSFEEVLLSMDGIVVGGGNTLNMMAIWKAQGIDQILKTAWDRGIVLGGGSAGSLCWFEHGTTDSRPKEITKVDCLGFLKGSHCPHFDSEPSRRPRYHAYIKSKEFKPGYAVDDRAAIYFEDNEVKKVVAINADSNAYYVYEEGGEVREKKLDKEVIS
jgi:dipeptidase E